MSKCFYKSVGLALLFPILLLEGCASIGIPKEYHVEYARSFMKNEVIPFAIRGKSLEVLSARNLFSQSDEEVSAEYKIDRSYGVVSPILGVKENFVRSLPSSLVEGEFVNLSSSDVDVMQVDGWLGFTISDWKLTSLFSSGYTLSFGMHANIYYKSGNFNSAGQEYMATIWMKSCEMAEPEGLSGAPLDEWLDNRGEKIKEAVSKFSRSCGKMLALDLVEFLDQ